MNTDTLPAIVGSSASNQSAQKPGVPKLVLPAQRGRQTRREREGKIRPKGFAALDIGDFAARYGKFQREQRLGLSRRQIAEQKEKRQKARVFRPFDPQKGAKVLSADATPVDKARGRVYLTLSNGQVLRPDKLLSVRSRKSRGRTDGNPVLVAKAVAFITSKVPPQ